MATNIRLSSEEELKEYRKISSLFPENSKERIIVSNLEDSFGFKVILPSKTNSEIKIALSNNRTLIFDMDPRSLDTASTRYGPQTEIGSAGLYAGFAYSYILRQGSK